MVCLIKIKLLESDICIGSRSGNYILYVNVLFLSKWNQ